MRLRRAHTRLLSGVLGLLSFLSFLGISLAGCQPSDGSADADAGMPADADAGLEVSPPDIDWLDADAGLEVSPPDIDWLDAGAPPIAPPSFTPCPDGWREVGGDDEGDPATCAPYPEGGPDECADGWAHFVGEPGCTLVGAPCPAGDFPVGLPTDSSVLYVLAGAGPGGDGSEGAPLMTIREAMDLASHGTVIALGKGTYDEAVYLAAGVTLWGACAAETRLTRSSRFPSAGGVVQVFSADTRLQNVRIGPAEIPGLAARGPTADLTAEGVLIESTRSAGLGVTDGAHVRGRTLCVSDMRADGSGEAGYGISVQTAGSVELTRISLSRAQSAGVFAGDVGTSVMLTDLVIRDTQGRDSDRAAGRGLNVQRGATAEVSRALIERNREFGVRVSDAGSSAALTDIVVRGTLSQESNQGGGRGLSVERGATAEVTRALIERNRDVGVIVGSADTTATLTDLVIRDTRGRGSDGKRGRGLYVQRATVDVTRALFARNHQFAVVVAFEGGRLELTDIVVEETADQPCAVEPCAERPYGVGLASVYSATMAVTRFTVMDSALCGGVLAENAELDLSVGLVSGSPVGVCLQMADYPVTRLTDRVRYVGNDNNLDATSLPLPNLGEPVGPAP